MLAVFENWTVARYSDTVSTPGETKRFKVRVSGPLPGRPWESGAFTMAIRRYGDKAGWWIAPIR